MTSLIIALPLAGADATALHDYVLTTTDGLTVAGHASVPLALLPVIENSHVEVVALVPAQALSWFQVSLPKGSLPRGLMPERGSTRLRAILEGLLEDRLLDDPAQLHLALQPHPVSDALVWVAACDRAWLKAHLQALAQAGHAASRIVPEFTPEITAQSLYVLDQADRAMLVGGGALQSVSLLLCPLSAATVALMDDESASAVRLEVVAEPAVAVLAEELFKRPVTLMQRPQRWLQAAQTPWDLAQFDLLNANRDRAVAHMVQGLNSLVRAPQWRAARFALLLLLVANLIGLNAWAWREQASLNTSRLAVRNVLMQTFPKIPAVVDAPVQMAREVAALQRASGTPSGSDMESMLAKFGVAAPDGLALTAIDYVAQELRVKTPPMALKDQDRLVLTLKQQGLSAAWDGAQWVIKPGAAP